jgi:hypothetical protein
MHSSEFKKPRDASWVQRPGFTLTETIKVSRLQKLFLVQWQYMKKCKRLKLLSTAQHVPQCPAGLQTPTVWIYDGHTGMTERVQ